MLAELVGTPRQIEYAARLRAKAIVSCEERLAQWRAGYAESHDGWSFYESPHHSSGRAARGIETMKAITSAEWWINWAGTFDFDQPFPELFAHEVVSRVTDNPHQQVIIS